jgi:chromatin assembly factor 1 subunit B
MSSSDGFCSTLTFAPDELGQIYTGEIGPPRQNASSTVVSSSQNTPMATPTSTVPPPSPFPSSNHQRTSSNHSIAPSPATEAPLGSMRPSSPTRSNSTSSIATQSSFAHHAAPGTIISNPPLVGGSLPGVVAGATGLGFVSGVPMTTPPQTPRSTTSSISGIKRDASESEKEDNGPEKKKRRIAPTLLGSEQAAPTSGA